MSNSSMMWIALALVAAVLIKMSWRLVQQYQGGVVLRLGRLKDVRPPGLNLIIPLFDRNVPVRDRIGTANRLLGSKVGDREEAIEVMSQSEDPWLRACAAYAIGEMRLTRFAEKLDDWARDEGDPLLRATAVDAREKLRHAATASAGVDAL